MASPISQILLRFGMLFGIAAIAFFAPLEIMSADDALLTNIKANIKPAFEYSDPKTYRLKVTIRLESPRKVLRNVVATAAVPIDWPEQKVTFIKEIKPRGTSTSIVKFPGIGAMLVFRVPTLPNGATASVERIYEVTRKRIRFLLDPKTLRVPKNRSRELRSHLIASPGIETTDRKIRGLAKTLRKPDADGWTNCRTFYDWVRTNVKYELGDFRGAKYALQKSIGDCEDMSALFIALCRNSGIPARSVWIQGHAYPEFYLEDESGRGHWIPAQVSGPPWFGEMIEYGPILQKGDRVKDPIRGRYSRYVPHSVRSTGGSPRYSVSHTVLENQVTNSARQ